MKPKLRQTAKANGLPEQLVDRLTDLEADTEGLRALASLIEKLTEYQEAAVIRMTSDVGAEEVFRAKVRAEGARRLLNDIKLILT